MKKTIREAARVPVLSRLALLFLCGVLFLPMAGAIPLEVREPGFTLTLPEGFMEVTGSNTESRRFFMSGSASDGQSNTSLTISRLSGNHAPGFRRDEQSDEFKILGRYSERLNNQDVAVLVAQVSSNNTFAIEQSASVPIDPGILMLDLRTHTDDDKKAHAMMRKIIRSLVTQARQQADRPEIQGWRSALICLTLVAIVFIVALARR